MGVDTIMRELLDVGEMMSNVCYNLAHPNVPLDDLTRENIDIIRLRWDAAVSAYHKNAKKKSKEKRRKAKVGRG